MAKSLSNAVLDAGLDVVNNATELYLCTSEPTDRAGAIAASLIPAATPTFQPNKYPAAARLPKAAETKH